MESKPSTSPAIPKIRTFADDLKRVNPTVTDTSTTKPSKPPVTPKAKAATALPNVVREPAPKPIPKPPTLIEPRTNTPPAFHTLQKTTAAKIPKAIPKKILRDTIEITGSTDDYDSTTIIKDTVRRRTNFFSAVGESLGNVGRDFKRFWKKANQPLYVIPEAERRKGVIQQATSQTGKTFTADYDRLKERLRQRAEQSDLVPEQDITWSPLTEPGFDLLPGDTSWNNPISNVKLEPKRTHSIPTAQAPATPPPTPVEPPKPRLILPKKATATPPAIPPPVVIEPKPIAAPVLTAVKAPVPQAAEIAPPPLVKTVATASDPIAPIPSSPTSLTQTPIAEPVSDLLPTSEKMEVDITPPQERIEASQADVEELAPEPLQPPAPPTTRGGSPQFINRVTTNTLTVAITGGLVVVVLVVVLVTRLVGMVWSTATESPISVVDPVIGITTLPLREVTYTITTPEPLLTALTSAAATNQDLHELYVTQPQGGNWTSGQLLTAQNLSINPAFGASLSELRWVAQNGVLIGLVFRYTNPTQITGSLLGWEASMGAELGRLLPVQDRETNSFTDLRLQQADVRQARNGVTYGLASDTHGIIAVSSEAFTTIAGTLAD